MAMTPTTLSADLCSLFWDFFKNNNGLREIKGAMNNRHIGAAAKIQKYLDQQNKIPLNIGITGESGSGKSSVVNAFIGLDNRDMRAAPTGCIETTMEVTPYAHPNYPNVTLWDLPGIGTTKFPADKYLKHVEFEKFDFFIIISETRFRENDVKLAKEIQKMEKKFYFVHSKIDNDLNAEEKSQRDFSVEKTLARIRENCVQGLQEQGVAATVFLVSSFDLHLHDFPLLQQTFERELPANKRDTLLLAVPNINLEIINRKKVAFQANLKYYAGLSAVGAAVPLPGLSGAVDLSLLVDVANIYAVGFGLDKPSLERLAATSDVPLSDLMAVIKSPLAAVEITSDLIVKMLTTFTITSLSMMAEEGLKYIPLLGIPVAAIISFTTTYKGLSMFLNTFTDDAQRVFNKALGLDTSV
ncbi:interferon-inducible GTPase 5-like [Embiotoca jacksoni]|uniref:interferon-inducible GTPase 5-like n=1 Tax=Embiotoca jacksoni TaxID=100190 RepID=UPI0037044BA3